MGDGTSAEMNCLKLQQVVFILAKKKKLYREKYGNCTAPCVSPLNIVIIRGLGSALETRVDNFCVSVKFSSTSGTAWWLSCVYGPQGDDNKILFLQELRRIRASCQGPWLVLGDFNLIVNAEEKNNGNLNRAMMGRFRCWINDLELIDVILHGRKFTWSNQQNSPTLVRLDRVLCSSDWKQLFPNSLLQSAATEGSDHCPLLLSLDAVKPGRARFHFEAFWTKLEGFHEAVEAAWSSFQLLLVPLSP